MTICHKCLNEIENDSHCIYIETGLMGYMVHSDKRWYHAECYINNMMRKKKR